jgi:hypothetical protein
MSLRDGDGVSLEKEQIVAVGKVAKEARRRRALRGSDVGVDGADDLRRDAQVKLRVGDVADLALRSDGEDGGDGGGGGGGSADLGLHGAAWTGRKEEVVLLGLGGRRR